MWPASSSAEIVDRIVANVNSDVILLSDVRERIALIKEFKGGQRGPSPQTPGERNVLDDMINEKLVVQFAEEREIKIKEEEIDKAIENIIAQNKITFDILEETLKKQGMSMEKYRDRMKEQMMVRRISGMEVSASKVTEAEVKNYYRENMDLFIKRGKVRASHIILLASKDKDARHYEEARSKIVEIKAEIDAGLDFGEAAKKYSQDGASQKGGDLGWFSKGRMIPEFEQVAFSAPVGEVVGPVTTTFGFHLIMVTEKEKSEPLPFEQVEAQIGRALEQESFGKKRTSWIERLRSQAYIKVLY